MQIKLKQLTQIRSGLVLSRKKATLQSDLSKNYNLISLKSFSDSGYYEHSFVESFEASEEIKEEYLIKKGDILLRLREPSYAVYIDKDYEDTIYPSLVCRISIKDNNIDPRYLTHFLNSNFTKKQLNKGSTTAAKIPLVKVKDLENLDIQIPPMQVQKNIIDLQSLASKECELLEKLVQKKKTYTKQIFEKIVNQEIK